MKVDTNFRFALSVSREGYTNKDEAKLCLTDNGAKTIGKDKMAFKSMSLTVEDFKDLALSGHSFAHIFNLVEGEKIDISKKIKSKKGEFTKTTPISPYYLRGNNKGYWRIDFKRDAFFKGAQAVFVDIDYTDFEEIGDYTSSLTYMPTVTYATFSDKEVKNGVYSRRFRMVYVFDRLLNGDEFKAAATCIHNQIIQDTEEEMDDYCGERLSQYMNGTNSTAYNESSDIIYSFNEIVPEDYTYTDYATDTEDNAGVEIKLTDEQIDEVEKLMDKFDKRLLYDLNGSVSNDEAIRAAYYKGYHYITRTKVEYGEKGYINVEDYPEFRQLLFTPKDKTFTDGHHRRNKLYARLCERRMLEENVTMDDLLFNAWMDVNEKHIFDNSDGVFDLDCLKRKAAQAMMTPIETILQEMHNNPNVVKRPKKIAIDNTLKSEDKKAIKGVALKEATDDIIAKNYDMSKSVKENLEIMASNGIKVKQTRLYEWVKKNNIETVDSRDKGIATGYNPELTLKENQKEMGCSYRQVIKARDEYNKRNK